MGQRTVAKSAKSRSEAKAKPRKKGAATEGERPRPESVPPIVGIGASAGGLEAFTQLLKALRPDTGMAFVLVQHLEARHESILARLLASATRMAAAEVRQGMRVQPSHVYVIPPNADLTISGGVLQLVRRKAPAGYHMPIDHFFRSLAEDQGARAIGVILSGTASDGTLGMKAIKAGGGVTFAQAPETAKYDGMPRSAIAAECIDFVLSPERIAAELAQISRHPYVRLAPQVEVAPLLSEGEEEFGRIFKLLQAASGVDFTYYKKSTIKRRVARRMALHNIESLGGYVKHLKENRQELDALYQDILIHVTSFFREPDVFLGLQNTVFPQILAGKSGREAIRIWVPGCSTGEEVYSIAICLLESVGKRAETVPVQIFGTDINDKAIEYARAGIYPESALQEVSKERLRRFFERSNEHYYQVSTAVRETCVFARHDLTKDPPFSKLDLISCRNVLIYLEPVLQKRALSSFHYALKDKGALMLGRSETLGGFPDLFTLVDRKNKFFTKRAKREEIAYRAETQAYERLEAPGRRGPGERATEDFEKEVDRVVWERYTHAGFVVDAELQILLVRGDTSRYLRPAPGRPVLNLLKMLREELVLEVRAAIQKARRAGGVVRREAIRLKQEGRFHEVTIEVRPLSGAGVKEKRFLVLFEPAGTPVEPEPPPAAGRKRMTADGREVARLNRELKRTKEYLQAIIQEQETTNEELKSANEEALSSMEELQSTNEELETAKEELQSSNEELVTMNEQAQTRNAELAQLSDDLTNVLSGVNIPILLLGGDRRIRRFTPTAEKLLHLLPADVGRPVGDIRLRLDIPSVDALVTATIQQGREQEREVRADDGRWYSMRMCPYRTREHKTDGVLISFVDIDGLKQIQEALRRERNFVGAILDAAKALLVIVLDRDRRIVHFNRACQELTGYSLGEVAGKSRDFLHLPQELGKVNASFARLLDGKEGEEQFAWVTKDGRRRLIAWSTSVARSGDGAVEYVIRTGVDVTEHEEVKEQALEQEATMRALMETAAEAIVAFTREGRIALANAAAGRMFGYAARELIGRPVEELVPRRFAETRLGGWTGHFLEPSTGAMGAGRDLAGLRKDGTEFPVEVNLSSVETKDGTLAVAFISDITERKRSEGALRESEARLRGLSAGLLGVQEEERKRVSRELHDDLNQRMAMLAVGVAELEARLPDSARAIKEHLQALEKSLAGVSDDLKRAAHQLHPSVLEHLGLVAAFNAHCEDVSRQGQIKVRFRHRNVPEKLPEAIALCLYRVAQECLRNVAKHSCASRASVSLIGNDTAIVLAIKDRGKGFDPGEARKKGGLGLVSMEERVRLSNGTVSIRTKPGDGTHVTIQIPLEAGSRE